jgi:hypothetical protein
VRRNSLRVFAGSSLPKPVITLASSPWPRSLYLYRGLFCLTEENSGAEMTRHTSYLMPNETLICRCFINYKKISDGECMFVNRIFFTATLVMVLTACGGGGGGSSHKSSAQHISSKSSQSSIAMSASSQGYSIPLGLHTWWHDSVEQKSVGEIAADKVRRSPIYDVRVSTVANPDALKNTFVYMSIPRGGKPKEGYSHEDGAEFADLAKLSMSWTSFLFDSDVWVEVDLMDGESISNIDEVIIRPTTLNFEKVYVDSNTIRIKVPYSENGYRFSVEFDSQQFVSYNNDSGNTGQLSLNDNGYAIHREPKNSLLIFAQPNYTESTRTELVPSGDDIFYPDQGKVNLSNVSKGIVYFKPGIYYMDGNYHAYLPANIYWIYLAPGAYVKGAFQFRDAKKNYKVTGYGVLSGEQYVYEPDKTNGYKHRLASKNNCHGDCVKMLQFQSSNVQQKLRLQGVTINEPPYHSFVLYGNENTFSMDVSEYQQVGSWYWQTDGIELYSGSSLSNAFFHSNDDVLKLYHSNLTVDGLVVWKNENGPVIQMGWSPRNMQNISAKNIDVIHNRMYWKDQKHNTCIINFANSWEAEAANWESKADVSTWIKNITLENIRSEGMNLCAMRIYALSNMENIRIKNLSIEKWNELPKSSHYNFMKAMRNESGEQIGITSGNGVFLENYLVEGQPIVKPGDLWEKDQLGRIDFDPALNASWGATASITPTCLSQELTVLLSEKIKVGESVEVNADVSSGLPLVLSVGGAAEINGRVVTAKDAPGKAVVRIEQVGNDLYCAVSQSHLIQVYDPNVAPSSGRWIGASWKSWSPGALEMLWSTVEKNYQITTSIPQGSQEIKFTDTNNWSGEDWGAAIGLSGSALKTTGGGDNIKFSIEVSGNYVIKFNPYSLIYSIEKI